jgi:hypothetical protein
VNFRVAVTIGVAVTAGRLLSLAFVLRRFGIEL